MHRADDIVAPREHGDGQAALADELGGMRAHDVDPDDAVGRDVHDQLDEAIVGAQRRRAAVASGSRLDDRDLDAQSLSPALR